MNNFRYPYLRAESFPVFCKDTKETCYNYSEYLQSLHWQLLRKRFYDKRERKCHCCDRVDGQIDLHHITYINLGSERIDQLICLCHECHGLVHEKIKELLISKAGKLRKIGKIIKKYSWKIIKRHKQKDNDPDKERRRKWWAKHHKS